MKGEVMVDEQATDERLFELYEIWCERHGVPAKYDSFQIWKEENYD